MKDYTLSPQGAEDKLSELYALPDLALAAQAIAIAANFQGWINDNFILTPAQELYIDGMNSNVARYFGGQCSLCFINRININLVYPTPPTTPGYAKWTGSESTIKMATDGGGNMNMTGSLTFTISYVH